jgi:type IV pilus assembly protein PilC
MSIKIPIALERDSSPARAARPVSATVPFWKRDITLFRKGLSDARKERLFRELHLLLHAGVDPRSVLDLLLKAQKDDAARRIMSAVREGVMRGQLLSTAMEGGGAFTEYEVQSIRIGEESGRLPPVCLQLADHHAEHLKLMRMVRQAFAYPAFILCITLGVVFFMMNVVVPMFAQVFARSGAELPALTQHVLSVSAFLRDTWYILLMLLVGVALGLVLVRKNSTWLVWSERIGLRLPVLGPLRHRALLARFCKSMAFLLHSGSPLDRALELSERMSTSPRLRAALASIRTQVIRGSSLQQAMAQHAVFDGQLVAMIGVAEEVKQLDTMFARLGERYAADVQHRTAILGSVLEPATILVIACLVGTVLVAMYLPMFKLSTTF